jgi:site-specific recombinase XerD
MNKKCYNFFEMGKRKPSYYEESNRKRFEELSGRLKSLPFFCREYFIGIEPRTSVLTRLNYARDLEIFFHFLHDNVAGFEYIGIDELTMTDLEKIKTSDIEYFLSYITYYEHNGIRYANGEKAKARKLSAVRSMLRYFYNKDKLSKNVASKVATPKLHEKEIIRLNDHEVKTLLDAAESEKKFETPHKDAYNLNTRERDAAILTLFLGTGIRVSELVGLNVTDINTEENAFTVTRKGGNRTTLYYSPEVGEALSKYIKTREKRLFEAGDTAEDALFLSLRNKRLCVRAVQNLVKKYTGTVNPLKEVSPHKLRSTYGTALYRETKDIYVVAEVLGHRDVNTTKKHYAAISEDIKREASSRHILRSQDKNKK